jgi:hypothetical protein
MVIIQYPPDITPQTFTIPNKKLFLLFGPFYQQILIMVVMMVVIWVRVRIAISNA